MSARFLTAELWDVLLAYRILYASDTLDRTAKSMHLVDCYRNTECSCSIIAVACVSMRDILTTLNKWPFILRMLKYASPARVIQATPSEITEATKYILSDEFDDRYWTLIATYVSPWHIYSPALTFFRDYETWVPSLILTCNPDVELLCMLWRSLGPLPLPVQDDDDRLNQFSNFLHLGLLFDVYSQVCSIFLLYQKTFLIGPIFLKRFYRGDSFWGTIVIPDEYYQNPRTLQRILALKKGSRFSGVQMPDFLAVAEDRIECAKPAKKDALCEAAVPPGEEPVVPSTTSGVVTEASESLVMSDAQEQGQSTDLDLGQGVSDSREEVEFLGCDARVDLDTSKGKDEVISGEKDRNTGPESVFWRCFVYILLWIVNYYGVSLA